MRALAFLAVSGLALVACGDDDDQASARPRGEHAAHATGPVAHEQPPGETTEPSVWAATPTPLADELARTESREACVARVRGSLTTDVSETLAQLGYGLLADDTCGALEAARAKRVDLCDALSVSAMRRACRVRVALVAGRPDDCPPDAVLDGRDPTCLAWASRDASMCRGASAADATRCRAVLANDGAQCGGALSPADCRAEVARYGSVFALATVARAADAPAPAFTLTLGSGAEATHVDAHVAVARGVVVTLCAGVRRVTLGPLARSDHAPPMYADAPSPWLSLALRDDEERHGPARVPLGPPGGDARLVVALPHRTPLASDTSARANVTIEAIDTTRGGRVVGTFDGTFRDLGQDVHVEGRFSTFVRDVSDGGDACGG